MVKNKEKFSFQNWMMKKNRDISERAKRQRSAWPKSFWRYFRTLKNTEVWMVLDGQKDRDISERAKRQRSG